ncbi:MAG TPA: vWA domain-containing protein, partial [Polyangiales bacterium]
CWLMGPSPHMKVQHYLYVALSVGALSCAAEDPIESVGSPSTTPGGAQGGAQAGAGTPGGVGGTGTTGSVGGTASGTGTAGGTAMPGGTGAIPPGAIGGVCQVQVVESGRITPDMLIVLDRSGSMRMGNVNRWDPSVMALKTLTSSLGATINFGLMAYPGNGMMMPTMPQQDCSKLPLLSQEQINCIAMQAAGGINNVTCGAGTVDVPIAANNGARIAMALDGMQPNGATPTAATLKAAHTAVGTGKEVLDGTTRPKYVLLVTDGAPNCSTPNSTGGPGGQGFDNAAVDQSVAEITAMAQDGIKTYVIGYGTRNDQQLSAALNRMAVAGGTGDMEHRSIEDGMGLLDQFTKIAGQVASCEFTLNMATTDPRFVEVKLDGKVINLNDANGWVIADDRRRITVQGRSCAALSATDQKHSVAVRVLCEPVPLE